MLSGCDYLDSIPGIGLKTAHRLLRRHKTVEKVVQMIKLEGTLHVPVNYIQSFAQAELAFIHQRVYDPTLKKLVPLNEFPQGGLKEDDQRWVGLDMAPEVARGIAEGNLHPETGIVLEDICPEYQPAKRDIQKVSPRLVMCANGRCLLVLDQKSRSQDRWMLSSPVCTPSRSLDVPDSQDRSPQRRNSYLRLLVSLDQVSRACRTAISTWLRKTIYPSA
jgi:hypothetical protein